MTRIQTRRPLITRMVESRPFCAVFYIAVVLGVIFVNLEK